METEQSDYGTAASMPQAESKRRVSPWALRGLWVQPVLPSLEGPEMTRRDWSDLVHQH